MTKSGATKRIIQREFERKREEILRMKQLDLTLEKRHTGIDDFKKGDMRPFVKETKTKLKRMRKDNLVK
jgi:hypothetical protein